MDRILKLRHYLGLALFLGSILTFIVVSAAIDGAGLENAAFGRSIISTGTAVLTIPGMWVLAVTGIAMSLRRHGFGQRYIRIKLLLMALIILNACLLVVPAATEATDLAVRSLADGRLLEGYRAAYMRESICGGVNVLMTIAAAVIGIWRFGDTISGDRHFV